MKKAFAWLMLLVFALNMPVVRAQEEAQTVFEGKGYGLEVRSVDVITSLNGKYRVLKQVQTSGYERNTDRIRLEYDFEEQKKERIGRYEEDAPLALVYVDGFEPCLAGLEAEDVVVTVDGRAVEAEADADHAGHIGWQDVRRNGGMSVVFPVVLTKEGGSREHEVCVRAILNGTCVTERARITVELVNTREYKAEKDAVITDIRAEYADAYIIGDAIYVDHPVGVTDAGEVTVSFAQESGEDFEGIIWAEGAWGSEERAALDLKEAVRLDERSAAVFALGDGAREAVVFVLQGRDALYKTKPYRIVERFNIRAKDPQGICFAQSEKKMTVGEEFAPVVLGIADAGALRSGVFGKLTLRAGEGTDAQVIDVTEKNTVIAVRTGAAYITARYETAGKVYEGASMKIEVTEAEEREYTVRCSGLNIRSAARADAERIGRLRRGDRVRVARIEDGWAQLADGGYAAAQYLK